MLRPTLCRNDLPAEEERPHMGGGRGNDKDDIDDFKLSIYIVDFDSVPDENNQFSQLLRQKKYKK